MRMEGDSVEGMRRGIALRRKEVGGKEKRNVLDIEYMYLTYKLNLTDDSHDSNAQQELKDAAARWNPDSRKLRSR